MSDVQPRYPVFIPSKGRAQHQTRATSTVGRLREDGVPFFIVVEPQEADEYADVVGADRVLTLPFSNLGLGSIPARNWIKDYATAELGAARHWQLDDNIKEFRRVYRSERIPCSSAIALRACEDFTDRYENVAISGLNYQMFAVRAKKPFVANCHVYSCTLVNNAIPHRWRGRYNEDTDLCLQVLAAGWCTLLLNVFVANKERTMIVKGGNSAELYEGDGRLRMARALERVWPGVVSVDRRFERPQHVIRDAWRKFDTPLKLRDDLALDGEGPGEYGMRLIEKKPLESPALRRVLGLD